MRKGHLITCLSIEGLQDFDKNGYVGVGPFHPDSSATDRKIGARLRILWDVIADLKRVRPGDVCFLHSERQIFGPYVFTSTFRENSLMPPILQSANITYDYWIKNKNLFANINVGGAGYIASIQKPEGCSGNGADLMELFLNQSRGLINGVPPRFMYGDTKKIVKPLLNHEIIQLLEITKFNGKWIPTSTNIYPINGLPEITLDLSNYGGHIYCEKLLEAWFMQHMFSGSGQYNNIKSLIGDFNYYSNSTYTYYTNFLDILAYSIKDNYSMSNCGNCNSVNRDFAQEIKVIELKRDYIGDPSWVVDQVEAYVRWAQAVLNPKAKVEAYIVAAGFGNKLQSIKTSKPNIGFIQYSITANGLNLKRV